MKAKNKKKKYLVTAMLAIVLAGIVTGFSMNGIFETVENIAEDRLYQRTTRVPDDIKIIMVDEKTLGRLGPYNGWDRSFFAGLLEILNESEETAPKVIGLDFVFSGSDGTEADEALVKSAGKYKNVVAASTIEFDRYTTQENGTYGKVAYICGEEKPFEALAAVVDTGFTNAIFDPDGVIRRTYTTLTSYYFDEVSVYDSFAYKIVAKTGRKMDYDSEIEIAFTGKPGDFEAISMADVLDGAVPSGYFKDCIVLIGAFAEGMMDAYRVPVDYSAEMYGVELQANIIDALLHGRVIYEVNEYLQLFLIFAIVALYAFYACNTRLRNSIIVMPVVGIAYFTGVEAVFRITSHKMNLLAVPVGIVLSFWISFLYRHFEMQKERMLEMQGMLFSMAEAMAAAIEGRTPYNANHTKNVARRCVEMLDYINAKHRKKETGLFFTKEDKQQLYLAAMLHDVGKMDVPLEVMDKPTKLGNREKTVRDRLEKIALWIELDARNGLVSRENAQEKKAKIQAFLDSLEAINCGRSLREEEWQLVNEIAESRYIGPDGQETAYLTVEENDALHIKAGTLSERERQLMQSHVTYTEKILSHIQFGEQFKNVRAMAANHHELLNGRGYPKGLGEKELDTMTRILTIMDIYDSLIAEDRPYKKPKSVKEAFEILEEEAENGRIDKELLKIAKELYLDEEIKNGNEKE